jgi:predicted alpha/beta-fold hydrolase
MSVTEVTPFRPAWWLPGSHLQTIGGRLLRRFDRGPLHRERVELPDGDFVDLHERPSDLREDAPTVLILHGLEGSSRATYVWSMARELARHAFRVIRMNFRGCSDEPNRLPRFYHAGDTSDLDTVVRTLRSHRPDSRIAIIGFSLGGNTLLKYLGERGSDASQDVVAAAAVSVPFDLVAGTSRLEGGGMGWFYSRYFVRKLTAKARGKRDQLARVCEIDRALGARTVREYDEHATAQFFGYRDAWHYYRESSCHPWVEEIRVPTLLLHALDDPLLPPDHVPSRAIRKNPWIVDGISPSGGHVGFVAGTPWNPVFWAEREAARFVARKFAEARAGSSTRASRV